MTDNRCEKCAHPYGAHWGYGMRNPCHVEKCDCKDYEAQP